MNKTWYKSKTVISAIAYLILSAAEIAGLDGSYVDGAQLIAFIGMILGVRDAIK